MNKKDNSGPKNFEEALTRLEEIVDKLDSQEIPLEDTISLFEEGQGLIQYCTRKLEEVKFKIEKVVKTKNGFKLEPFSEENTSSDEEREISDENGEEK